MNKFSDKMYVEEEANKQLIQSWNSYNKRRKYQEEKYPIQKRSEVKKTLEDLNEAQELLRRLLKKENHFMETREMVLEKCNHCLKCCGFIIKGNELSFENEKVLKERIIEIHEEINNRIRLILQKTKEKNKENFQIRLEQLKNQGVSEDEINLLLFEYEQVCQINQLDKFVSLLKRWKKLKLYGKAKEEESWLIESMMNEIIAENERLKLSRDIDWSNNKRAMKDIEVIIKKYKMIIEELKQEIQSTKNSIEANYLYEFYRSTNNIPPTIIIQDHASLVPTYGSAKKKSL